MVEGYFANKSKMMENMKFINDGIDKQGQGNWLPFVDFFFCLEPKFINSNKNYSSLW